jgi:thiamine-monophosphate kinase
MLKTLDPDEMPSWLKQLFATSKLNNSIVAGVDDDDCAILKWNGRYLVVSIDFLNANPIASELGIGGMADLGRLLVAANLSDLCGSGAAPVALLVGITLEREAAVADYKKLMRGIRHEASIHGVPVIGGDSKLGSSRALLAVAIGSAESRKNLFLKNAAKSGHIVWTSGQLGSTAAAAWGFKRSEFGAAWKKWAKQVLLVPRVPLVLSRKVSVGCYGRAGTDISDGLGADLDAMCKASHVGAIIDVGKIPVAKEVTEAARVADVPAWKFAFASGGDFQFVVTSKRNSRARMSDLGLHEIGEITESLSLKVRLDGGQLMPLSAKGHRDHRRVTFTEEIDYLVRGTV